METRRLTIFDCLIDRELVNIYIELLAESKDISKVMQSSSNAPMSPIESLIFQTEMSATM